MAREYDLSIQRQEKIIRKAAVKLGLSEKISPLNSIPLELLKKPFDHGLLKVAITDQGVISKHDFGAQYNNHGVLTQGWIRTPLIRLQIRFIYCEEKYKFGLSNDCYPLESIAVTGLRSQKISKQKANYYLRQTYRHILDFFQSPTPNSKINGVIESDSSSLHEGWFFLHLSML